MTGPLELTPVKYAWCDRTTHSDVVSTITTYRLFAEKVESRTGDAQVLSGASAPLCLPVSNAKRNKILHTERKLFMERLNQERNMRADLEVWASTLIQSTVRGFLTREKFNGHPSLPTLDNEPTKSVHEYCAVTSVDNQEDEQLAEDILFVQLEMRKQKTKPKCSKKKRKRLIILIQRTVRGFIARRGTRSMRVYHRLHTEKVAAITIQAIARKFITSLRLDISRQHESIVKKCTILQAAVRGWLNRRYVSFLHEIMQKIKDEIKAAVKIQSYLRKNLAKNILCNMKKENAVIILQKTYRMCESNRTMKKKEAVVNKLQSVFRGHAARKAVQEEKNDNAATSIQKLYRSRMAYKKVQEKKEEQAAVKIQSVSRARAAQKTVSAKRDLKIKESCARKIQTAERQRQSRKKKEKEIEDSATQIQSLFRGNQSRKEYTKRKETKAATKIQSRVRSHQVHAKVQKEREKQRDELQAKAEKQIDMEVTRLQVRRTNSRNT